MPLHPHPNPPPEEGGSSALPWARPCPNHHPKPLPLPGGGQGGGQQFCPSSSNFRKTYPRPPSLPYPLPRFLFGRRDRPMEGDQAGAQDVDVQRGSWHYMLRHGDRSEKTGAPGWAVLAITGKPRRPGAATPHFLVPETLSLRDPSTFSPRRKPAGRLRAPGNPKTGVVRCSDQRLRLSCPRRNWSARATSSRATMPSEIRKL